MPTPTSRSKILPARGSKANLDAALAAGDLLEGELCYAKDEDALYQVEAGVLVKAGGGGDVEEAPQDGSYYVRQNATWQPTTSSSISYNLSQNQLSDLGDTAISGAQPGEALIWNGVAWANGGDFTGGSF